MEPWLQRHGAHINYTRFFEDADLPDLSGLELLVVMGGPMSVNDEAALPWLVEEKKFLRAAIERGIPVLGICLGAQLIAAALGARVFPNLHREIGWFDIEAVELSETSLASTCFAFPARAKAFHWHGETFELPPGAIHLARSAACPNQAFQIGRHVLGLQFHLETTPASARALVAHCRDDLSEGEWVQTEDEILKAPSAWYEEINDLMAKVLDYLTRQAS